VRYRLQIDHFRSFLFCSRFRHLSIHFRIVVFDPGGILTAVAFFITVLPFPNWRFTMISLLKAHHGRSKQYNPCEAFPSNRKLPHVQMILSTSTTTSRVQILSIYGGNGNLNFLP
jgi:hypothetical protein